jgi:DNA-binding IclR family transcriptional regulator
MSPTSVNLLSKEPAAPAQQAGVGLLKKTFQILDLFTEQHPNWTQAELVRETGLSRSTLGRLVRFLCSRGYLLEQRGRYTLGFAAIDLGRRAQLQFNLVDLCSDLLEEVAQATAETVILTGYDEAHARVVCLAQIPSRQGGLRLFENIGNSYPLHSGATAKAVLAFLPERQANAVLDGDLVPVNPAAHVSAASLRKDIAKIRSDGYAVTYEETYPGVTGVAVPVLTPQGLPLGSIAIAGPAQRIDKKTTDECAAVLLNAGQRAAARIAGGS